MLDKCWTKIEHWVRHLTTATRRHHHEAGSALLIGEGNFSHFWLIDLAIEDVMGFKSN
jgi:hypothetical protein